MSEPSAGERVAKTLTDPWALLTTGVVGGAAWAVGLAVPVAGLIAVGTLGTAALISAVRKGKSRPDEPDLRPNTDQAALIHALNGYVSQLQYLTMRGLATEVATAAADALRVAQESRARALRVALAIDLLDSGIDQNAEVRGFTEQGSQTIQTSIERMAARRQALLQKLRAAVDQIASVYAQLVEVSTTASTLDVSVDSGGEIAGIGDSLTALQKTFTELENDAAAIRGGAGSPRNRRPG